MKLLKRLAIVFSLLNKVFVGMRVLKVKAYLDEANDYLKEMSEYVAQINGIYR